MTVFAMIAAVALAGAAPSHAGPLPGGEMGEAAPVPAAGPSAVARVRVVVRGPVPGPQVPGDTVDVMEEVLTQGLEEVAGAFARAWARGEIDRVTAHLAPDRIQLQFGASRHSGLTRRQASATVRDLLRNQEGGSFRILRLSEVGGTPNRGFAEVKWGSVPRGTTQRVTHTVYVGFLQADGRWWVSEIRVLR